MNVQLQYGGLHGRYSDQATGWAVWVRFLAEARCVSPLEMSRSAMGTTQPLTEWAQGLLPGGRGGGLKQPGREVDHLHRVLRFRMGGGIPQYPDVPSWIA